MKKKSISALILAGLFSINVYVSPLPVYAAFDAPAVNAQLNTTEKPNHVVLTWTDDPKTTQTISWWTNAAVSKSIVEYGEVNGSLKKAEGADAEKFVTNVERKDAPGEMNIHAVTLTGLQPGKTYRYRVGDGKNWSEFSTFSTENAKSDSFKVLLFADSQNDKADYQVWHDTLYAAYSRNKDAKFMINLGDMSDQGQDFHYFNNWFDASAGVIDKIPEMPVMGNHECRDGKGSTTGKAEYYLKLFKVPQNGPLGYEGQAYSYDYGNAHFVVLDSQMFEQYRTPEEQANMLNAQVAWVEQDLAATKKPWKFVFYHRSQYNIKTIRNSTYMKTFEPVFDKYHVDMVFTGHDHGMARTYPIKNNEYMPTAAEGTVYFTTGRTNLNTKSDISPKVWNAFAFDPQNQPVYQTMEVSASKMTVNTFELDGRIVDSFVIDKATPANSTIVVPSGRLDEARLVLFGNAITWGAKPVQANGTWYIDFNMLVSVTGAKYDKDTNTLSFAKPKGKAILTDEMFKDSSRKMISLEALRQLGFECYHQQKTNFIMVERITNG